MDTRHRVRGISVGASALVIFLSTTLAAAKESKRTICTPAYSAYKSALERRQSGHLREAREFLSTCVQATACGGLLPKCAALSEKMASEMPTVVPVVTDEAGEPRVDVRVEVDGELLTSKLDGKGLPVEAGLREFSFSTDRGVFATQKVLVVEGQRNRPIPISMGVPRQSPALPTTAPAVETKTAVEARAVTDKQAVDQAPSDAPVHDKAARGEATTESQVPSHGGSNGGGWAPPRSVFPYTIAGVGLAGVAAGGLLTYWGNKDNSALESQCSPHCRPSSLDHIRTMYIAADISFGVAAAALAVTTWLFASSRSTEKAPAPSHSATLLDIHPTQSGAFASVSGAF